jgi:hypothetical protein
MPYIIKVLYSYAGYIRILVKTRMIADDILSLVYYRIIHELIQKARQAGSRTSLRNRLTKVLIKLLSIYNK